MRGSESRHVQPETRDLHCSRNMKGWPASGVGGRLEGFRSLPGVGLRSGCGTSQSDLSIFSSLVCVPSLGWYRVTVRPGQTSFTPQTTFSFTVRDKPSDRESQRGLTGRSVRSTPSSTCSVYDSVVEIRLVKGSLVFLSEPPRQITFRTSEVHHLVRILVGSQRDPVVT